MATRQKLQGKNAPLAFKIADNVYNKRMTLTEGRNWLVDNCGFNPNTAADLINDFRYLMNGESYERTLNGFYTAYYLQNIYEAYGQDRLGKAISALEQHIDYYEGHYKATMHKLRGILFSFTRLLADSSEDRIEQSAIEQELEEGEWTKDALAAKIQSLETDKVEVIVLKGLAFKRKNWIIALIKELRDHRCQICDIQILKRTGGYYIEAAHITAKASGGVERRDNILILCPNHHKEFDLGEVEILERKTSELKFVMNSRSFTITL